SEPMLVAEAGSGCRTASRCASVSWVRWLTCTGWPDRPALDRRRDTSRPKSGSFAVSKETLKARPTSGRKRYRAKNRYARNYLIDQNDDSDRNTLSSASGKIVNYAGGSVIRLAMASRGL